MASDKRLSEIFLECEGYKDLVKPVLLTSGELGIYYVNTEKLVQDGGEFEKYGDGAELMGRHACEMMEDHPTFRETIDIIAQKVNQLLPTDRPCAISGGQRRDWLFSIPVAEVLEVPHLALYKQVHGVPNRIECDRPGLKQEGLYVVHVVDLITEASSCYRNEAGKEFGWIPMLRNAGAEVNELVAVVNRNQGGREALAKAGVMLHDEISIDEAFLKEHSKFAHRAVAYLMDPRKWSEDYLAMEGPLGFVADFDPAGKKLDRAKKFAQRYGAHLEKEGRMQELRTAVEIAYGQKLEELVK